MKVILLSVLAWTIGAFALHAQNDSSMAHSSFPYAVDTVRIMDTIDLAYVQVGEGPDVLLLHGLGSNLKAWWKNLDSLSQHFRCTAIDFPGYGCSSKGEYPSDMHFFAEATLAAIDALDLGEVTLVGHSMGGQVSIHAALRDQQARINRLALLAPAGFEQFSEAEVNWFKQIYQAGFLMSLPDEQVVRNFELNFTKMPDDARFMIADRMAMREDSAAFLAYCHMIPKCVHGMLAQPVFDQLSSLKLPVLVVYGEADQLIPNKLLHPALTTVGVAETGAAQISNAKLELLPDCGHFIQWECAAAINRVLKDFAAE